MVIGVEAIIDSGFVVVLMGERVEWKFFSDEVYVVINEIFM